MLPVQAVHLQANPALAAALSSAPPSVLWDVVDGPLTKTVPPHGFINERDTEANWRETVEGKTHWAPAPYAFLLVVGVY